MPVPKEIVRAFFPPSLRYRVQTTPVDDEKRWRAFSRDTQLTLDLLLEFPQKPWVWGSGGLSSNPTVTIEILHKFPHKPWIWGHRGLSINPSLTLEWLHEFPDKPWEWAA